jgi:RNA polymerase sigma factor (sigma-70 family)
MTYSSLSCDELVQACVDTANAEAWQEFIRRFEPLIKGSIWCIARRYRDNTSQTVADLVQDTYCKFCANNRRLLREFKPFHEGACHGWVKVVAMNVARDHYRPSPPPVIDGDIHELEGFLADPRAADADYLERRLLIDKIDSVLRAHCSARDREIFWLHYGAVGFTAAEIARMSRFKLNEKGVESVLHRLRSLLRSEFGEED